MDNNEKPQELKTSSERLDDAIESTFPASDPIAISPSRRITEDDKISGFEAGPRTQADLNIGVDPRKFALWGGLAMVLIGVGAYLIPGSLDLLPPLRVEQNYGLFLNWFPMNIFNKGALLLIGLAGFIVAKSASRSLVWCRVVAGFMVIMAVLGLIPATATFFGYIPLFGGEVVAHTAFALIALYFSYYGMPKFNSGITSKSVILNENDPSI